MVAIRMDHRIANRVDASDIVQEALAQAFVRLPKYLEDRQIPFYPWSRRIACDRLSDAYRVHVLAEKRSVLHERHDFLPVSDDSMANLAANVAAVCYDPHHRQVQVEEVDRAIAALNELRPADREVLVLRYLEHLSVAELAAVLEISETAVTTRRSALCSASRLVGGERERLSRDHASRTNSNELAHGRQLEIAGVGGTGRGALASRPADRSGRLGSRTSRAGH